MRRRRSSARSRRLVWAGALMAFAAAPRAVRGQGGLSKEGALFLLVPVGARVAGMGLAVVASEPGSEALWWNPAGLARFEKREVAINHSQTLIATGDALDAVVSAGRAGVVAGAAYYLSYGDQQHTDAQSGALGTLYPRDIVLAASYSATFGARVRAGVTYKYVQERLDCTGSCGDVVTYSASTSAFDFGLQTVADKARRVTLGVAVRNLGLRLQANDVEQADALPTRVHLGAQYTVPSIERVVSGGELRLSAEFVDRPSLGDPSLRAGGEFVYEKQYALRAGYATGSGDAAGAAIGIGVQRGGISMDFARSFGGLSSDAGKPPTYVTLRFRF